jgi:hypothetical protein
VLSRFSPSFAREASPGTQRPRHRMLNAKLCVTLLKLTLPGEPGQWASTEEVEVEDGLSGAGAILQIF